MHGVGNNSGQRSEAKRATGGRHEGDGWGRISDDGSGHYNPNPCEDPWGGGVISLHGGAQSSLWPDTVRDNRVDSEVHKGRMQTGRRTPYAGSRLELPTIQEGTAWKANFQPYWGKPAVRNDREDRGKEQPTRPQSSGVQVPAPPIACLRAVSISDARGGNEPRSART